MGIRSLSLLLRRALHLENEQRHGRDEAKDPKRRECNSQLSVWEELLSGMVVGQERLLKHQTSSLYKSLRFDVDAPSKAPRLSSKQAQRGPR